MQCPRCRTDLDAIQTPEGVTVLLCRACKGTWYERGGLALLVKRPTVVGPLLEAPLLAATRSPYLCPRCKGAMERGGVGSERCLVDRCAGCGGIWLDAGQRARLDEVGLARATPRAGTGTVAAAALAALPSLAFRSTAVLVGLYALTFLALLVAVEYVGAPPHLAVLGAVLVILLEYLLSPLVMDVFLRWLQSLRWADRAELPPRLVAFIERVARARGLTFPRIGIIDDGSPNAFTYGHHPRNARLVLTAGLLQILDEDELEAVVGHELGHVAHWDFVVMTVGALVPAVLYFVYRLCAGVGGRDAGERRRVGAPVVVLVGIYLAYVVAEYLLLFLSRAREYYADRFSGEATRDPNALARALTKVAYGLANAASPEEAKARAQTPIHALAPLGIFDPHAALALAVAAAGRTASGQPDLVAAMRWDLWNPWAGFYELGSTHPLPAKRILALGDLARRYGRDPAVAFTARQPESYWDEFFVGVSILVLPFLLPAAALTFFFPAAALLGAHAVTPGVLLHAAGVALAALGLGALVRTLACYRGATFPASTVASLLGLVKVSAVRPQAVTLRGTVIGRGIPGLVYSEDLVLRDASGFILLDYRQPFRLIELWFGLARTSGLIGRDVVVTGWYRRGPMPFVEMNTLTAAGTTYRCRVYPAKLAVCALALVAGLALLLW